jgi:hypothetical protein
MKELNSHPLKNIYDYLFGYIGMEGLSQRTKVSNE